MKAAYQIEEVFIKEGFLYLKIDGTNYRFEIANISESLADATTEELNNFEISPSGYGIHFPLIDEDISVAGLLKK